MRLLVAAGRFDATTDNYYTALYEYATIADVIVMSEVAGITARLALRRWAEANGWHLWHPKKRGAAECAILSRARFNRRKAWRLTNLTLAHGRTAPIFLTAARISDGPWIGMWHTPAHNKGLRRGLWPTRVYRSALAGLRATRMRMHRGGCALCADWNLDLRRRAARDELDKSFPHMTWGWTPEQHATEGGRVIDGVLTNLLIVTPSVTLPAAAGFDHRAVLTVLGGAHGVR